MSRYILYFVICSFKQIPCGVAAGVVFGCSLDPNSLEENNSLHPWSCFVFNLSRLLMRLALKSVYSYIIYIYSYILFYIYIYSHSFVPKDGISFFSQKCLRNNFSQKMSSRKLQSYTPPPKTNMTIKHPP